MLNYYTLLRVSENATTDEIKSAYRILAKEYHPDINPNNSIAEEYFKKINEAYAVLRDPIKRNWYNILLKGNAISQNVDPRKYGTRSRTTTRATTIRKEEEQPSTPYWLKQLALGMSMSWCLLIIYNNWFTTFEGSEFVKMVFAYLFFIVCVYFFVNNLYGKWQKKQTSFNPENRSLVYFILLFFFTIPAFFVIGFARKEVHMKYFPAITEARIIDYRQSFDDYWVTVLYFDSNNLAYTKEFNFKSKATLRKSNYKILIKYSTREPRIMKFKIKLTGKDSIFQEDTDNMNRGNDYFE